MLRINPHSHILSPHPNKKVSSQLAMYYNVQFILIQLQVEMQVQPMTEFYDSFKKAFEKPIAFTTWRNFMVTVKQFIGASNSI